MKDLLGNELKVGDGVILTYNNQASPAVVVQIQPGGVIGRSVDAMPVAGLIVFQILVPLQINPGGDVPVWKMAIPSNQEKAMQGPTPEVPS